MTRTDVSDFLQSVHPYDSLPAEALAALGPQVQMLDFAAGAQVYALGQVLDGVYLIQTGAIAVTDAGGAQISQLGPRNSFGERGIRKAGKAVTSARATEPSRLLLLPKAIFLQLIEAHAPMRRFFDRQRAPRPVVHSLATSRVDAFMTPDPLRCSAQTPVQDAAAQMAKAHVSAICVTSDDGLEGIVTLRDMTEKVVAQGRSGDTPLAQIMTPSPLGLPPHALGSDVLHLMIERGIGHIPVTEAGRLLGMVTQTDLTRFQATSSAELVREIAEAGDAQEMARATARIPQLLVQLQASGHRHEITTRLITDIADAATRRLLALGEAQLGPAPRPYLWLACGSQGRQEQTGVSDQDNCMILDGATTKDDMGYFARLARFVCDGLDACGYVYCPGEMMAMTPRWCQPLPVWQGYFDGWIDTPSKEAQMLASVMFDLRPIAGERALFDGLQARVLARAARNSIFVAHMTRNALTHAPPLGLLRGLATIRSGEHRSTLDLKHNGVVPITDLGRLYALRGKLSAVNTRARLEAAQAAGLLSESGGRELLDAYDMIAETRLEHQAAQIRASEPPDNYLAPADLSDFERSHLRDAFVVVKSLQSAVGQNRGALG